MTFLCFIQVRKVRKVLRADDLLAMDAKANETSKGVINPKDLGSRTKGKPEETVVKAEPTDMEIDFEMDDLAPRK